MNTELAVQQLAALAQSTRLAIYRLLVVAGEHGLQPNELAESLQLANATLSFHLKNLQHADLISVEQQGRCLRYRANYPVMNQLIGFLTENCCQGQVCDLDLKIRCC
mgnify:CR=1 FL=1